MLAVRMVIVVFASLALRSFSAITISWCSARVSSLNLCITSDALMYELLLATESFFSSSYILFARAAAGFPVAT